MVTGKGFNGEDFIDNGRCRFGVETNYAIVQAQVLDYNKLVCRSPEEFQLPEGADQMFSVPFSIAFGEEDFKPWTLSTHRYRFYKQPYIEEAKPEEVRIGKFSEIYVYASEDSPFFERKYPILIIKHQSSIINLLHFLLFQLYHQESQAMSLVSCAASKTSESQWACTSTRLQSCV